MTDKNIPDLLIKHPLLFYIRSQWKPFSLGMFFLLITNLIDGLSPLVIKQGIDQITAKAPVADILKTGGLFFLAMATLAVTRYYWRSFFGTYHTLAADDLRNRVFRHLSEMGPSFYQKNPVGELMSLLTNDVQAFRQAIGSGVLILVDGVSIIAILLPIMLWLEPTWTWKTLIFLPLVPFLIWKVNKLIYERFKKQQDELADLSGFSQELVAGIRVVKSFVQEKQKLSAFNSINSKFEKASNRVASVDALFVPVMQFGVASGTVILLFIASGDLLTGVATIGTLVAFQRYISKMVWPMTALGLGISQFQKGMAAFSRIRATLEQISDLPSHGTLQLQDFESLKVKDLTFAYPGNPVSVLQNVSFELRAGQKMGIVGPVGSGKSTLLHLLSRLYPTSKPAISINDMALEEIQEISLRKTLAFVPQDPFLFSQSVRENLSYGLDEPETMDVLKSLTGAVDLLGEVESLPQGFDSQLGERGVNLSGGQKQRMTIARGLLTRAPLVMLDDSLSAVDHKTEQVIQEALRRNLERRRTQIIVAHRLSSVLDADQILVLNQGTVEAIGTHAELLAKSATYRSMAELQGLA